MRDRGGPPGGSIADPPIARALFGETRWAWVWVVPRLYVGAAGVEAGWAKWHSPAWTGTDAGTALSRFVTEALAKTGGRHPDVPWWYARFLADLVQPYPRFWSYLVSTGELLVGVALLLGLFTGLAAFFGGLMNMSYLLAGTVSTNPLLFVGATLLMLAWKTAGWWGFDRWLLPALGTPWRPGPLLGRAS